MKRVLLYSLFFAVLFSACEDIYEPKIDDIANVIVADARIVKGSPNNYIVLTESQGFNDEFLNYPPASGGKVTLIDNEGISYELPEHETGKFSVNVPLEEGKEYKMLINYGGNTFESEYERVPLAPVIDSVYGIPEVKYGEIAGSNDADDISSAVGVQLYANMKSSPKATNYRFTAHKVIQYTWVESTDFDDVLHYYWDRYEVNDIFNIAAPPEYSSSTNITKHPLYFFRKSVSLEPDHYFRGWIMILYQYNISESAYSYYDDLNAQLDSEGRIFDPVYVQARSNLKCINNPETIILGNFEISNITEHRYFVNYVSEKVGYRVEEIYERYPIPWSGETIDSAPEFWVY